MQDSSNKSERRRSKPSTPVMSRKLRSEEKVSLQNAVPLFSPDKKTDPTTYEPISPAVRKEEKNKDEVNVSAEGFDKGPKDRLPPPKPNKPASKSSDQETDDMATSELFPAKKALRYNKNSGKYDDISY
ncbi:hypothetical protein Q1695_010142 [Nippostrongylus brasiliensis]|nr:hypothetical protein Q1695_010142 [Nippostrongylus brasiliensis]